MSSFSIDASGQRSLSLNVNDPKSTRAQVASVPGDHCNVQLGAFKEVRVVVPLGARLERRKGKKGDEFLVLIAEGSLSVCGRAPAEGEPLPGYPHGWLTIGKHLEDFTDSLELVEVVHARMGDLIPPTEG